MSQSIFAFSADRKITCYWNHVASRLVGTQKTLKFKLTVKHQQMVLVFWVLKEKF